jgi:hypothetical protein
LWCTVPLHYPHIVLGVEHKLLLLKNYFQLIENCATPGCFVGCISISSCIFLFLPRTHSGLCVGQSTGCFWVSELAIAGILEEGYFVCSHINAVRSTAVCLHTLSFVFVWFSDLRGFISMMNVEVQKQQPMGLIRQLSCQDSLSSPGLRDDRGWTPLHVAARMGDLTEVSFNPSVFDSKCVHLKNRLEFCRWNVWAKPKWWPKWWALKLLHCP